MKICNKCFEEKPLEQFYEHRGGRTKPGYRIPTCKTCHKESSNIWAKNNPDKVKQFRKKAKLKEKYGLSLEDYCSLYEQQEGACYLCGIVPLRERALNVDHCHITSRTRRLLCDKCNLALGLINDDKKLLQKMIDYLNEYSTI